MRPPRQPRILLAKVGLDGHDRGIRMIARELMSRGAEVILLGVGTRPVAIAHSARDEDVDAIGVSILSGAHAVLVPDLLDNLRELGLADTPLLCGGAIPHADAEWLRALGVRAVLPTGTSVEEAATRILEDAGRPTGGVGGER